MTERTQLYNDDAPLVTLSAFKGLPSSLKFITGEYIPPTPTQIKALRHIMGWSQTDVAKLVGVSFNHKGSTAVRKWETATDKKEHNKISYSAWRGMLLAAGVVTEF